MDFDVQRAKVRNNGIHLLVASSWDQYHITNHSLLYLFAHKTAHIATDEQDQQGFEKWVTLIQYVKHIRVGNEKSKYNYT